MQPVNIGPLLQRRLAWDILPCPMVPEFLPKLGLLPGTDGGDEIEHRDHHYREAQVMPLVPLVTVLSTMATEIARKAILDAQGLPIDTDPELEHYSNLVSSCTLAVLANLIDSELIHITNEEPNV